MNDDRIRELVKNAHRDRPIPGFEHVWGAAARQADAPARRRSGRTFVVALAGAAGLAALWMNVRPRAPAPDELSAAGDRDASAALSAALPAFGWPLPSGTDFLLETPGRALLRTTPQLDLGISVYGKDLAQ